MVVLTTIWNGGTVMPLLLVTVGLFLVERLTAKRGPR